MIYTICFIISVISLTAMHAYYYRKSIKSMVRAEHEHRDMYEHDEF